MWLAISISTVKIAIIRSRFVTGQLSCSNNPLCMTSMLVEVASWDRLNLSYTVQRSEISTTLYVSRESNKQFVGLWNANAEWRSWALILALLSKVRSAFHNSLQCNFLCGCGTLTHVFQYFIFGLPIWTQHCTKKNNPSQ